MLYKLQVAGQTDRIYHGPNEFRQIVYEAGFHRVTVFMSRDGKFWDEIPLRGVQAMLATE